VIRGAPPRRGLGPIATASSANRYVRTPTKLRVKTKPYGPHVAKTQRAVVTGQDF
jgi:hypothetical protein